MAKYRYNNIFLFASFQFCGNIIEYFSQNSEKAVIYITQPRFNNKYNIVRLYKKGKLISEYKVISSGNIFFYHIYWYITYIQVLLNHFSKREKVYVITWQPYFLFGMSIQKIIRNIEFVYWIGDYFPPVNVSLKLYEKIKKYYHDKVTYSRYLSDRINKKMNGKLLENAQRSTTMWGVNPEKKYIKKEDSKKIVLLFIGVIRESQGIELLLQVIKENSDFYLKLLGSSTDSYFKKYNNLINKYNISDRVEFPNRMFYGDEIIRESRNAKIGIALYDVTKNNASFYADPGKIKTYAQYGLPILMTPIADVEKYIIKFSAGEVVGQNIKEVERAIKKIKRDYRKYLDGLEKFNNYFYYENYYQKKFKFLEK
jgi:hypothetical protein